MTQGLFFLEETPEHTFDFFRECKLIITSDLYWNDAFSVFVVQIVNFMILRTATWVKVTLNQRLFEEEQNLRYAFLSGTYLIMFFLLLVSYLLAHTLLSAYVHRYWDKERIKNSNVPGKSVEKRHVNI